MKLLLLFLCALTLVSCSRRTSGPAISPSGLYSVETDVPGESAGPTRRLCIRLKIHEIPSQKTFVFQTGASNTQKWAIGWSPNNVLILYSSDIGIYAYETRDGIIMERPAAEDEKEIGRDAYEKKFGQKPRA